MKFQASTSFSRFRLLSPRCHLLWSICMTQLLWVDIYKCLADATLHILQFLIKVFTGRSVLMHHPLSNCYKGASGERLSYRFILYKFYTLRFMWLIEKFLKVSLRVYGLSLYFLVIINLILFFFDIIYFPFWPLHLRGKIAYSYNLNFSRIIQFCWDFRICWDYHINGLIFCDIILRNTFF